MNHIITRILGVCISVLIAGAVSAAQNLSTEPDGKVTFQASTQHLTRLHVKGHRISRIVNDASDFLMSNDENTGDVFFKFDGEDPKTETGYILTEKGSTISYVLKPVKRSAGAVIITIKGSEAETSEDGFSSDGAGFTDNVASTMTNVIREVAQKHVMGKAIPKSKSGRTIRRVTGPGWKAAISVAVAGKSGRLVREQEFYRKGVRAIWIQNPTLAAGERSFVITVEAR